MKLRLLYTHKETSRPVLATTIMKTGVPINILEAQMTPESGQMIVDVPVDNRRLKEVVSAFETEGVRVQEIVSTITIDFDKCMSCGACVSPCPVSAITQKTDWDIEYDEKKCIRCKVCVDACPVGAIAFL
ncbi:4Fe-4S binding protein [Candidatus Bathyarchaeota archaeon]|nr:4Fe-4S binding protein [Candidatus Bathyarchaeota archaeon]